MINYNIFLNLQFAKYFMNQESFIIIRNFRRKSRSRKASFSTAAQKQAKESFPSQQIRSRKLTMIPTTQKAIQQELVQDEREAKSEGFIGDNIDQYFWFHDQENRGRWVQGKQFQMEKIEIEAIQQKPKEFRIKDGEVQCEMEFQQFKAQDFKLGRFNET